MTPTQLTVDGVNARVLRGEGSGRPAILLLHGGRPGLPYAAGAHLWDSTLDLFAGHTVVAPDLPGFGLTPAEGAPSFDRLVQFTAALLRTLGTGPVHAVGHDEGGLVALRLTLDAPELLRSITVVSSLAAAPSGDGVENLTLASPPAPLGSRGSQAWALERLAYDRHHVTPALLDSCVAAAAGPAFQSNLQAPAATFVRELMGSKARLYEAYRGEGVPVPVQLIWGSRDPISTLDHAETLHRLIGARQSATQCHIVNRVGYFPFREDPAQFHRLVTSFLDGLAAERRG